MKVQFEWRSGDWLQYEEQEMEVIPRLGERVAVKDGLHKVIDIVHYQDEEPPHIDIELES
jgi:hypothetical protein